MEINNTTDNNNNNCNNKNINYINSPNVNMVNKGCNNHEEESGRGKKSDCLTGSELESSAAPLLDHPQCTFGSTASSRSTTTTTTTTDNNKNNNNNPSSPLSQSEIVIQRYEDFLSRCGDRDTFSEIVYIPENKKLVIDSREYTVGRKLGDGKNGQVIRIYDANKKGYALKSVKSLNEAQREFFALNYLADVNSVANLALNDIFRFNKCYYLVLELYDGDLVDYLNKNSKGFGQAQAVALFRKILQTVKPVHEKGMYNADQKLDNILFRDRGSGVLPDIVVADFGGFNPHAANAVSGYGNNHFGTESHWVPEQCGRVPCDRQRAEIFQLGVLFFYMLTSSLPFGLSAKNSGKDSAYRKLCENFDFDEEHGLSDDLSVTLKKWIEEEKNADLSISDDLWFLISRMMHPNPIKRASLSELLDIIESLNTTLTEPC